MAGLAKICEILEMMSLLEFTLVPDYTKYVLQVCTTSMYYKYVLQVCTTSMYYKCVLQYVLQVCTTSVYYKYVLQVCTTTMYYNYVLQVRTNTVILKRSKLFWFIFCYFSLLGFTVLCYEI